MLEYLKVDVEHCHMPVRALGTLHFSPFKAVELIESVAWQEHDHTDIVCERDTNKHDSFRVAHVLYRIALNFAQHGAFS